jgi:hypothetical protein
VLAVGSPADVGVLAAVANTAAGTLNLADISTPPAAVAIAVAEEVAFPAAVRTIR